MTREKAIQHLENIIIFSYQDGYTEDAREALKMAIEALKAKPYEMREPTEQEKQSVDNYIKSISKPIGFNVFEEPCEDAVKREAVLNTLDTMDKALDEDRTIEHYKELLKECYKELPPVTPAREKGEWIKKTETIYCCNQCGRTVFKDIMEDMQIDYPYCHCGADMRGGN